MFISKTYVFYVKFLKLLLVFFSVKLIATVQNKFIYAVTV